MRIYKSQTEGGRTPTEPEIELLVGADPETISRPFSRYMMT